MDCHNDDIMCIDVKNNVAVTGQRGNMPLIFVWDAVTGEKKARAVLEKNAGGLQCVKFSADGSQFACVDMSNDHNVYVFDTASGNQLFKQKGDTNKIYDICWTGDANDGSMTFCTVGSKHVKFWTYKDAKAERRGLYGAKFRDISSTSHCVCTSGPDGWFFTGASNGSIFCWKDNQL